MRAIAVTLFTLVLSACATMRPQGPDPAADIQRFLIAIRNSDRDAFERYVDRDALKIQLRSRVLAEAGRQGAQGNQLQALGALAATPLVGLVGDALIQPEVFRAVAERRGWRADMGMPTPDLINRFVRDVGAGSVCVVTGADDPCLLIFRNQGGTYRLVGFEGDLSLLMPGRRPNP